MGAMSRAKKSSARKGKRFTEADLIALRANVAAAAGGSAAATDGTPKRGKYNAKVTYVGTIKFGSAREARRYQVLRYLELSGKIRDLRLQVVYVLAESVDIGEKRRKPAMRYVADFVYVVCETCELGQAGETVVEDAKGVQTRAYRDRKHLMKSVHGVTIREV